MQGPVDRTGLYLPLEQLLRVGKVRKDARVVCVFPKSWDVVYALLKASAGVTVVADPSTARLFRARVGEGVIVVEGCEGFEGGFGAAIMFEEMRGLACINDLLKRVSESLSPGARAVLVVRKLSPSQSLPDDLDGPIVASGLKRLAAIDAGFFILGVYEKGPEAARERAGALTDERLARGNA